MHVEPLSDEMAYKVAIVVAVLRATEGCVFAQTTFGCAQGYLRQLPTCTEYSRVVDKNCQTAL